MNGFSNRVPVNRELPAGVRQRQETANLTRELFAEGFAGRRRRQPTVIRAAHCWMRTERLSVWNGNKSGTAELWRFVS